MSLTPPEDSSLQVPTSPGKSRRLSVTEGGIIKETRDAVFREAPDGQRTLNQYVLQHILGRGAYGTVYHGIDTAHPDGPEDVAIKEFSKAKLRRLKLQKEGGAFGARGRFRGRGRGAAATVRADALSKSDNPIDLVRGEIAILKKLDHPNVVRLYEVLDDPNQDSLYMVFELCEKGAIMDISLDKPTVALPEAEAHRIFRQMILGIEYLHEHEIAHRDIKPDNMLMAADGTLKIVDFGVSEMFSPENDKIKTSAGSPAFSAPEVCVPHHGDHSARACDIWAMGVTLYCMVFGKLPFVGTSIIDLYESIRNDEPPIPKAASPSLKHLLLSLLEKDPAKRITMDQLRTDPWVTSHGTAPLLPPRCENCIPVPDITEEDIAQAVKGVNPLFTVLKAVNKLKKLVAKGNSTDSE
ncbi:kinase-like domain-containing protein [Powellomyces hirtus]|nr:kinase-like domain-containing protein [Powellomyces hirtus]